MRVARELAAARVAQAEQFLLARARLGEKGTDKQAEAHAVIATKSLTTELEARLVIAERRLK
jgi:hypothetical protein